MRVYVMDRERAPQPGGAPPKKGQPLQGLEKVLCFNAADGKLIWKHEYSCPYKALSYAQGPRMTPLVHQGKVYTVGAMGDMCCLDAETGKVHWNLNLVKAYNAPLPIWGYAAHLLIDGDLLYSLVGGPGSCVVAFNKDTGKEVWKALTDEDVCYSPPMIYEAGGKRQLIVWPSQALYGLNPATGEVYWSQRYPAIGAVQRPAVNIATIRVQGDLLFLSNAYHGPMMLRLAADKPAATVLWKADRKKPTEDDGKLNILCPTPVIKDGYVYGVSMDAKLMCLDAQTGKEMWKTFDAIDGKETDCGTVFVIPQGDRFVLFNDQGDLILANLTPKGYKELSRARIIEPMPNPRGRKVVWSHPAFARRCVFARNDKEMVCVCLAADGQIAKD
jgi:outer membrane protein assembly factor BamB